MLLKNQKLRQIMANENTTVKKKRIGVLDVIIIIALCACLVAAGFAFVFKLKISGEVTPEDQYEEYVLSFESYGVRRSTAQMLKEGDIFYYEKKEIGSLQGKITTVPSVTYVQDENGITHKTYAAENGDYTKMDVSGTLIVKGVKNKEGVFLLNGTTQLAPNKSFTIYTDTVTVSVSVTDIEKVG